MHVLIIFWTPYSFQHVSLIGIAYTIITPTVIIIVITQSHPTLAAVHSMDIVSPNTYRFKLMT